MRSVVALAGLFCFVLIGSVLARDIKFPSLTGRVVDDAHVLSEAAQKNLTAQLQAHEGATGQQVVVATVPSLQGKTIEEYGYQLGRFWDIGQKGKNTGVIFLIAPTEHKVRIEVGYGLEGTLTDAESRVIIENVILPPIRAGHIEGGIISGTVAILQVLRGENDTNENADSPATDDGQSDANAQVTETQPTGKPARSVIPLLMGLIWPLYLGFFLLRIIFGRHSKFGTPGFASFGGGGGFDSFSSGGGSDSFSGGGGSFGGGGASGSW